MARPVDTRCLAGWLVVPALIGLLSGCGSTPTDRPADSRLPVFAGIPPLAYLVEQIGGKHVEVDVLVSPGQDPHTFEPTPQQVLALGKATIFFQIDMPFERVLLEKVREGNRRLMVVDTTAGITKRRMDAPCCEQPGGHGHDHHVEGGAPDPHVWLSPPLVMVQARNIAAALCRADPRHRDDYTRNLAALVGRLDALHQRIQRMLAPYRGRSFYVFHPGFGYFADAYGLRQEAVEAGGRMPTPKQLRALIVEARADGIHTIFVQPQYAPQSAQVVADALGAKVVAINGLGNNLIEDIGQIATRIDTALKQSSLRSERRGGAEGQMTKSK
jgi:zinc transport system substrate-binding protein